jgi:anti-sigma regulatory factor (Ser/Thr protein kinase)
MEPDEGARLAALRRYRILDTKPEQAFDDLTLLASAICGTPIALITLIDADRQWFKSKVGVTVNETSRSVAFCAEAIRHDNLFVVNDAALDPRFRDNPMVVGDPHVRFYAGAPLTTPEGLALGTLCVIDRQPRQLTAEQFGALRALRRQAQAQLELRANLAELEQALGERDDAEAQQMRLIHELRHALDEVRRLGAMIPLCANCRFDMVIPADPARIPSIIEGVRQVLHGLSWAEEDVQQVELALMEGLSNAIHHGCHNDPTKQIECCVTGDERGELTVVLRDPGPGFDRASVPDPTAPENLFKGRGRGIYMINELMDEVRFEDDGRELHMRKRRTPA